MEFIVFFLLKKLADMIQCLTEQLYHICLTIACEKGCSHISYLLDGNQNNKSCPEGQNASNNTGLFDMYPQCPISKHIRRMVWFRLILFPDIYKRVHQSTSHERYITAKQYVY